MSEDMDKAVERFASALSLFVAASSNRISQVPTAPCTAEEVQSFADLRAALREAITAGAVAQR